MYLYIYVCMYIYIYIYNNIILGYIILCYIPLAGGAAHVGDRDAGHQGLPQRRGHEGEAGQGHCAPRGPEAGAPGRRAGVMYMYIYI